MTHLPETLLGAQSTSNDYSIHTLKLKLTHTHAYKLFAIDWNEERERERGDFNTFWALFSF